MANIRKQSAKQSAKVEAKEPAEILVCIEKGGKDHAIRNVNALSVPAVTIAELTASTSTMEHLCLNLMSGVIDPAIVEAHGKRGGLRRLFPKFANADINALKTCMDSKPEAIVAAWNKHAAQVSRVRGITLQAIAKSMREPKQGGDKVTLRDAMLAWCADPANEKVMNAKAFPQSLVDIFIEFDLLPHDEEEEKAA